MSKNLDYTFLNVPLPGDIARRKLAGDLAGAIRLIDARLQANTQPELAPRLRLERHRLELLPRDYSLSRQDAIAQVQAEWPSFTGEQFDALVDDGRIDWRYVEGEPRFHNRFLGSLRLYPQLAPGLHREPEDNTSRDETLARMRREGGVTAQLTIRASLKPAPDVPGSTFQAWIPIPAACPQQSEIEILEATPGGICAPESAPQRTIWWGESPRREYSVTYRYRYRADCTDPLTIRPDPVQPQFDTGEEAPHIVFTPYLRALTARVTQCCRGPVEKAKAIYDYVTGFVDYRFQPAYLQLEGVADQCARELRGDCGMMALLFITMCRIAGIPARWQSGLSARPGDVGCHDWAMFYIAPHGWLWADCSYGSSARRNGEEDRRRHYFGSLDPWRMVANSACFVPLTPPDFQWRADPYDNQRGEMTADGTGLASFQLAAEQELLDFRLL